MTGGSDPNGERESEQTEVQFLFELYRFVGERLCERVGHDWETVRPGCSTVVTIEFDRCTRCNEERATPDEDAVLR